ncbi:MAG: hypothetical protein P4L98_02110 [Ancalomicrobiaceae bacterium]|nr:hypothetical protein [Ancalomicrobiaceae bacterium]
MKRDSVSRLLASAALCAFVMVPAAAEAQSVRDKVIELFATNAKAAGIKDIKQEEVTGDDAKFTLQGVTITAGPKDQTATVEGITFIGAKPTDDGGISADEIDVEGFDVSDKEGGLSLGTLTIKNVVLPAPANATKPGAFKFDTVDAGEIEFGDEKLTIPVESIAISASDYVDGIPHKGKFELKGMVVPIKDDDPKMADVKDLGYKEFAIDAVFASSWDDKAGKLVFDKWNISAKDVGSVTLSISLGGVTPEVVKQLRAAKDDPNAAMALAAGVSIESATLRIDNASLFERALEATAKKQGVPKDQLVQQAGVMVPMLLSAIQNPDFEKKVGDAVAAFLASPKSLTATVSPSQPVPVAQIIGVAGAAPQTLPTVLGADVTANK